MHIHKSAVCIFILFSALAAVNLDCCTANNNNQRQRTVTTDTSITVTNSSIMPLTLVSSQEQEEPPTLPCPTDMVLVDGMFCPEVSQTCAAWDRNDDGSIGTIRCLHFSDSQCLSSRRVHLHFCMDRFEYPNIEGANPRVLVTWIAAQNVCRAEGRRLCTSSEWTFACEGPEIHPYPYGNGMDRDANACRIDHNKIHYNPIRGANPATRVAEAARVYEALPSGEMARCVSWSGVHDLTGNVDEWVVNTNGNMTHPPYRSGLKGGWWGFVRTRCRPMTTVHGPGFDYYEIGWRCCENAAQQ